jgi:ATP-dependent Clp protease ATP-binding subunit ClpB
VEDTISILRGLKSTYELHHAGIRIKDDALVAAATLSDRYIHDRFQPDKSIDLIDEACSKLRLEQESKPELLWKLERELITKQIESSALDKEWEEEQERRTVNSSHLSDLETRRKTVASQVEKLQQKVDRVTKAWQQERTELDQIKQVKEALASAKKELEHAKGNGEFSKAGELLHATIPRLEQQLHDLEEGGDSKKRRKSSTKLLADAVTADAIATIVARHTGIPVSRITGRESKHLLNMEETLKQRVVGQDHALEAVSDCVRLARTRLQAHDRTLGNFLFVGPSGVGKTELCKALAEFIFDDPNAMTRIDMSEYSEKHTVSRLIGAPPGYVGYDEGGGILTEAVRRRPYQVILLDEFEKGHPEVWNLLLQLFDEGHLTDSHGRKVNFSNTIVVMTSNMGAPIIADLPSNVLGNEPEVKESIMNVVRHTLSPELLNRIDDTIVFNRLQRDHMDQIVNIGIKDISRRLESGQHMTLDVSSSAKDCIAERGYDPRYGARPLKRALVKEILNPLSRLVLEGSVHKGDVIRVRTRGEAMQLEKKTVKQQQLEDGDDEKSTEGFTRPSFYGWSTGSHPSSDDKNDIVILKNHDPNLSDNGDNQDDDGQETEMDAWDDLLFHDNDDDTKHGT